MTFLIRKTSLKIAVLPMLMFLKDELCRIWKTNIVNKEEKFLRGASSYMTPGKVKNVTIIRHFSRCLLVPPPLAHPISAVSSGMLTASYLQCPLWYWDFADKCLSLPIFGGRFLRYSSKSSILVTCCCVTNCLKLGLK